jgi:hypothetical protein
VKSIVATVFLSAFAMTVCAHDGMHGPGGEYDKDESGAITIDEYKVFLRKTNQDMKNAAARIAVLDKNKDGKLSSGEFRSELTPKQK